MAESNGVEEVRRERRWGHEILRRLSSVVEDEEGVVAGVVSALRIESGGSRRLPDVGSLRLGEEADVGMAPSIRRAGDKTRARLAEGINAASSRVRERCGGVPGVRFAQRLGRGELTTTGLSSS